MHIRLRFLRKYLAPEALILREAALRAVALTVFILIEFPYEKTTVLEVACVLVATFAILVPVFVVACRLPFLWTWRLARHEFTHLFSAQWNQAAPPLLCEGLSVWMQGTAGGRSIDSAAMAAMRDKSLTLDSLLTSPDLFRESGCRRYSCYLLAGSFTGFLIRHCGWERYQRFYCAVGASDFRETFKKFLGLSLEIAESRWRRQSLVHDA